MPESGDSQRLNRYSYVGNQPLGFIDPSGHAAICGTSADDGCGGIDALQSIEMQLRQGRLDPIGAKQAYYQYYLAHPGENAGAYQPLNPTEEFNGIISTGYAQAQAESGAANLGGLALGAATDNGVIFEAMSGYGGNAAHGIGLLAVLAGGAGKAAAEAFGLDPSTSPATRPYQRPSGSVTAEQRAAVQGKPCVSCGAIVPQTVADHKDPLVVEYYRTGAIDIQRMRDVNSVQPQCPTCSAGQGGLLSQVSRFMRQVMFGR
ncbi:MAG: hypothetical protein WAW20_02895 [Anaerolineae bacterium]